MTPEGSIAPDAQGILPDLPTDVVRDVAVARGFKTGEDFRAEREHERRAEQPAGDGAGDGAAAAEFRDGEDGKQGRAAPEAEQAAAGFAVEQGDHDGDLEDDARAASATQ